MNLVVVPGALRRIYGNSLLCSLTGIDLLTCQYSAVSGMAARFV